MRLIENLLDYYPRTANLIEKAGIPKVDCGLSDMTLPDQGRR
jgi:hypothetical protein